MTVPKKSIWNTVLNVFTALAVLIFLAMCGGMLWMFRGLRIIG